MRFIPQSLITKETVKKDLCSVCTVCVWNFCVCSQLLHSDISSVLLIEGTILKWRLNIQLNANFIQALKQNHIHSLNSNDAFI